MPNEEMLNAGQQPPVNAEPLTPGGEDTPVKPKDKPKDKEAESELLESMMFSPTSGDSDTIIEIDKTTDEKQKPETKELLEILEKGTGSLSKKYQKELLDKALKDPTSVVVETPRGWMTVRDAIGDGFNLTTNDFTDEPIPKPDWNGELSKLPEREQRAIRNLTKPGTRQANPRPQEGLEQGGDMKPTPTGEPIPPTAQGQPVNNVGAMGETALGGTELPLGGV